MRLGLHQGVWTAVLGVGGAGAIMVAPAQLWIGWSLIAASGLILLWGVRINGNHWWAYRRPNSRRIGLNDVARRVAYESEWGVNFEPGSFEYVAKYRGDPWKLLMLEICRPLTLGDIRAWGVKIERNKDAEHGPTEIPKEYWIRGDFHPELMLTEPSIDSAGGGEGAPIYKEVQLERAGVEATWPRLPWWRRRHSRFRSLYTEWRAEWEANHQDHAAWINKTFANAETKLSSLGDLWRSTDPLQLYQAACLWVGESPPSDENGQLPSNAIPMLVRLKRGVVDGDLPYFNDQDGLGPRLLEVQKTMSQFGTTPVKISSASEVGRAGLRAFAESIGERPAFLFGDEE